MAANSRHAGNRRPLIGEILPGASVADFGANLADRYHDFWH